MRRIDLLFACVLPLSAIAQEEVWTSTVAPVDSSGYWAIVLPPELVARSRVDLGDVRLLNLQGNEVPYVMEQEARLYESVHEAPFALLRNDVLKNDRTIVEVDVGEGHLLNELRLRVRKARVSKPMRLTGSDDRSSWYMVLDGTLDLGYDSGGDGANLRIVDIPASRYRYYRITLSDSTTAPVQVLDVGHTARVATEGRYVKYDDVRSEQTEFGKNTRLHLLCDHPLLLERLTYSVKDTVRYLREVQFTTLLREEQRSGRRQRHVRDVVEPRVLARAQLASYDGGVIDPLDIRADSLEIVVNNGNDHPMTFTHLDAWQLERRLVARLVAGAAYRITTGKPTLVAPRYDLVHFRDSLPEMRPILQAGPPIRLDAQRPEDHSALSTTWVWTGIVLLMAAMAWSAWRMLRKSDAAGD